MSFFFKDGPTPSATPPSAEAVEHVTKLALNRDPNHTIETNNLSPVLNELLAKLPVEIRPLVFTISGNFDNQNQGGLEEVVDGLKGKLTAPIPETVEGGILVYDLRGLKLGNVLGKLVELGGGAFREALNTSRINIQISYSNQLLGFFTTASTKLRGDTFKPLPSAGTAQDAGRELAQDIYAVRTFMRAKRAEITELVNAEMPNASPDKKLSALNLKMQTVRENKKQGARVPTKITYHVPVDNGDEIIRAFVTTTIFEMDRLLALESDQKKRES